MGQVKRSKQLVDLKRCIILGNPEDLEDALRDALKSVLGKAGHEVNPRARFHNKFQREIEEHDQDLEKKYDEDLNTSLIFVSIAQWKKRKRMEPEAYDSDSCRPVYSRPWRRHSSSTSNPNSAQIMNRRTTYCSRCSSTPPLAPYHPILRHLYLDGPALIP